MYTDIKTQIEPMLQGVAYWIAYKKELSNLNLIEADIVSEAAHFLSARLFDYYGKREVDYSSLNCKLSKQYADLGIFSHKDNKCTCIIEFKLGDNTSGGYKQDLQKVKKFKSLEKDITCLVVIAYRNSCSIKRPHEFVTPNGKAKRGIIKDKTGVPVKVHRVCNALASKSVNKMKKVVCIEVI